LTDMSRMKAGEGLQHQFVEGIEVLHPVLLLLVVMLLMLVVSLLVLVVVTLEVFLGDHLMCLFWSVIITMSHWDC